jgi:diguanylate cyclase (GGDEF)-like protein
MGHSDTMIFDQKTLKRIPHAFILFLILILGFPVIAINYLGLDFSSLAKNLPPHGESSFMIESQIRGYFRQALLQWSAFSLSAITVLLAFTQYRLMNDKIALIIGLAVLFSGSVEALNTVVIDGMSPYIIDKNNLDAVIWTFSNAVSGLIFIVGFAILLKFGKKKRFRLSTFILISALLLILAFTSIYYTATQIRLPEMWITDSVLTRPYELSYLITYMAVLFVYPRVYKKFPYILTNCIFYMAVTQIVIAIYLMLLSTAAYDSAYNAAYFFKIIVYFIPFACLIINYVFSYNAILEAQGKLKISQGNLAYIAAHDALTNLYNRREFEELLSKAITNSAKNNTSFALFVMDIDNFKSINDTLGHIHGDIFLREFSSHFSALTRKGDILSRIGGDEFTLITSKISSPSAAKLIAERIIKGLNIPYPIQGKLLTTTVSMGISIYPTDGKNTEDLLKNADIALYSAKKSGKNTYRFYTENLSYLQHREAEIEAHLREALKNDEFTLLYQPKYDLVNKKIIGAEILLRWFNQILGTVSPDEFIPVAENTGLIIKIGEWVLNRMCQQAEVWSDQYQKNMLFSINVSPVQFENTDFYPNLKKSLERFNFPPNYLDIEITESLLIKNRLEVNEGLKDIDALGVNISIDDFGMGYSSLSRLKSLPINTLKIDKSFVSDVINENDKVIVIDTIIKLAHELGMNIVAEGIETKEQLNYLISRNCYIGQGFLLDRPLTAEEFEHKAYQQLKKIE